MAVLTEASKISEVIITPEYNEEGIYTVRFCIQVLISLFQDFVIFCAYDDGKCPGYFDNVISDDQWYLLRYLCIQDGSGLLVSNEAVFLLFYPL